MRRTGKGKSSYKNKQRQQKQKNKRMNRKLHKPIIKDKETEDLILNPTLPLSADLLRKYYIQTKNAKIVKSETPVTNKIQTIDVSVKRNRIEDIAFLENDVLRERLRRGNTILKIMGSNFKLKRHIIGRRGMPKFFDLRPIHIRILNNLEDKRVLRTHKKEFSLEWEIAVTPIEKSLEKNNFLNVYVSQKANGETAQISYFFLGDDEVTEDGEEDIEGYWLICSKNVAMVVNSSSDIELYQDPRYDFAKKISRKWMKILEKMEESVLNKMKSFLQEHTLIGEYCGNENMQHLVKYEEEKLFFYSITKKDSVKPCVNFEFAFQKFEEFGLEKVDIEIFEKISNIQEFGKLLEKVNNKVASGLIETSGEGVVVYIEEQELDIGGNLINKSVISLFKLKTLEYRFWRKLREKLKNFLVGKYTQEKLLAKFKFECETLVKDGNYEAPREMDYYYQIAEKSCEIAHLCKLHIFHLRKVYINFLNLAKKCNEEERVPNEDEVKFFTDKFSQNDDDENCQKFDPNAVKVAANIILIAPPGFIDYENLKSFCQKKNIDLSFGVSQRASERVSLRLCVPSICGLRSSKVKHYTYCIALKLDEETDEIIENVCKKYKNFTEEEKYENYSEKAKKYFCEVFNNDFVYKNLVNKIGFEARKLSRCKPDKGFYYLEDYVLNLQPYKFNLESLDLCIDEILKTHQKKIINCYSNDFDLDLANLKRKKDEKKRLKKLQHAEEMMESLENNEIIFMIFYGLTCLGKTHMSAKIEKLCQDSGIHFSKVTSDKCYQTTMNELAQEHPDWDHQKLYEKSRKKAQILFETTLMDLVKQAQPGKNFIFLDKVRHSDKFLKKMKKKYKKQGFRSKIVAVYPECESFTQFGTKKKNVPFSLSLILNICDRIIKRKNHETVTGDPVSKVFIAMSFVLLYKNVKSIPAVKKNDADFYSFFGMPFVEDVDENEYPEHVVECLKNTLNSMSPFHKGKKNCEEICEVLGDEELNKDLEERGLLSWPAWEKQERVIKDILECFGKDD